GCSRCAKSRSSSARSSPARGRGRRRRVPAGAAAPRPLAGEGSVSLSLQAPGGARQRAPGCVDELAGALLTPWSAGTKRRRAAPPGRPAPGTLRNPGSFPLELEPLAQLVESPGELGQFGRGIPDVLRAGAALFGRCG